MNSRQKSRLVLCAVSTALLSVVSASSHAGRTVRSDSSDGAFDSLGGFWGDDIEQGAVPGFDAGRTEFRLKINPNGEARFFTVCMSEDGFLKFIDGNTACTDADYALPPTGNYIAVFATDLDSSSGLLQHTRGFVDFNPPSRLWQAAPAMRYWWTVTLAGDPALFDVQIVLIDRSNGSNNGNFDIELNYGNGGPDPVPPLDSQSNSNANGFQGFKLGPNSNGPTTGPFGPFPTDGAPIRFCFRDGKLRATCN